MSTSDVIATIGVAMLLLAFLLNQRGRLAEDSLAYLLLNFIGQRWPDSLPGWPVSFPLSCWKGCGRWWRRMAWLAAGASRVRVHEHPC
jgi:hypothetical protein